ncbi:MAG: ribonuclease D [Nocardioidaceae bacterium]|nr:ribonuclease D [Nocardioidaceae bacterium]
MPSASRSATPDRATPDQTDPDQTDPDSPAEPDPYPLLRLAEPVPEVVVDPVTLAQVAAEVAAGSGPVALDAERASGYRYSQRAYLLQLRRAPAGTFLVDPVATGELGPLREALFGPEWVLHAASQDLPCLSAVGLRPRRLFDTELAARLLDLPRVGLAALVEDLLGLRLAKEHSAADWSTRPLPRSWLEYAALDVEVLLALRDLLAERLVEAGKQTWAEQEFEALLSFTGPPTRIDPWRRTSGLHRVRGARALGLVRELWQARDAIAAGLDISPGRLLSDAAIVEVARTMPTSRGALRSLRGMRHRQARSHLDAWEKAIGRAGALADADLPPLSAPPDGPPPARSWQQRFPAAAARLTACRAVVSALAKQHQLPAENLLAPDGVRRLAWEPPEVVGPASVGAALTATGARPWQVGLTAAPLATALTGVGTGSSAKGSTDAAYR